ncbi:MAG: cell division topological specificity factor MinE [Thermoanaerobacteraceae bacterium]|nr:cell division topological specificity factor MinE [Thermoanaerobacteraceae bacterium]MBE3588933.1 cell division topological specificity factor MinE [Thermoanaerobacteraceae bacterium]HHW44671.1 cell division topological specificity factor MinE [Desulfotomaculum sp.]
MLDFLSRMFGRESNGSKNVAKERLRLVLVHDRASVSPRLLETLKSELICVISKYMDIDEEALEVTLDSNETQVALVASIPVKGMKRVSKSLLSGV